MKLRGTRRADVGLSPGNLHQYPVRKKNVLTGYEPWNKTPSSITKQSERRTLC
jgi:hypothetical protein